jgi:arsenate reductase
MEVVVYHNEESRLSLQALAVIRAAGFEPHVIHSDRDPPGRSLLRRLAGAAGASMRAFLRQDDPLYEILHLGDLRLSDEDLIDAMEDHPSLIAAPIVVTPDAVRLCRSPDEVAGLLPDGGQYSGSRGASFA